MKTTPLNGDVNVKERKGRKKGFYDSGRRIQKRLLYPEFQIINLPKSGMACGTDVGP